MRTISVDSGVLFDFNDDQMRTGTGWLDANDGFLAYDRNGNGTIDNGGELFGVDTRKSDGNFASDGFDALRDLDSNGDGVFNAEDAEFDKVRVWQDKNSDGVSQADELRTLDELGITAINLDSQETNIDSNGNRIAATGTVEFADGSTSTAANLDLSSNPFYREYTDTVEISEEIAALPNMQGSGAVRDLREAASQSTELAQLLEHYANSKTYKEQRELLGNLISAWAKSSGYANLFDRLESLSSGKAGEPKAAFMHSWLMQLREPNAYELAQQSLLEKIAILEAFNGRDFYSFTLQENGSLHIAAGSNISSTVNPPSGKDVIVTETHLAINPEQAALLDKAYQTLLDSVYEALLPQTRLKPYLDSISLKWNGSDIAFDYSAVMQQLSTLSQSNAVETVLLGFELKQLLADTEFDQAFRAERSKWISGLDSEQLTELNKYLFNSRFLAENESLYDKPLNIGTNGDDIIYGSAIHNNELYGGSGDDTLIAGYYTQDNLLVGGSGNDTLYGGYGSDTYLFNLGDGKDQIFEKGHYSIEAVDTLRFGKDIRSEDISMRREGGDFVFIHSNGSDQVSIKDIFSGYSHWDGAWINTHQVVEKITFSDGTVWNWDQIVSKGIISHVNNNDRIFNGLQVNDIIYGSKSDDVINGHEGDDVIYGGDGNDIIDGGIGSNQLYGGAGDDILRVDERYSSNNLLAGGTGNDILYGSNQSDTYLFHLGDGQDEIIEPSEYYYNDGIDTLRFGEGIRPEDISIRREGNDFLFIHSNGNDHVLIKGVFFSYPDWNGNWINHEKVVEKITFSDGAIWLWNQIILRDTVIHATTDSSTLHGLQGNDIIYGSSGDDVIYGHNGDDIIYGGDGNDILDGGLGSNQLYGGAGNDVLRVDVYSDNNILVGGTGNDTLYGSYSSDTYIFNLGDGQDKIVGSGGKDILRFGESIRPEDISMKPDGDDFLFIHSNGTDQIRISNVFSNPVEQIVFADGTIWHWDDIKQKNIISYMPDDGKAFNGRVGNDIIHGNAGDDILYGHEGNDVIYGGDGNDIIDGGSGSNQLYGGNGDDVLRVDDYSNNNLLVGGTGNDIIYGSSGADTYLFNLGDGQDHIFDPGCYNYYYGDNAVDTLRFGEGIRPEDISMRREEDDFLFIHSNGRDQVLIKNVFAMDTSHYSDVFSSWMSSGGMIKQVTFADGTVWDWKKLKQHTIISYTDDHSNSFKFWDGSNIIYGWSGNDIIYGSGDNDFINGKTGSNELYGGSGDDLLTVDIQSKDNILAGGTGNDTLQGSFYADTYVFNLGDGKDRIVEHGYDYYFPEVPLDIEENATNINGTEVHDANNDHAYWETLSNDKAIDKLVFGEGIRAEDLWFEQHDQDLIVKIIGTDDQVLIENWYEGKGYRIEEFHTADGRLLLEAEVNKMVHAMAAFAPQAGSESNLTAIPREQLDSVIAVHWQ